MRNKYSNKFTTNELVECSNCGQEFERLTFEYNGGCPSCGSLGYVREFDFTNTKMINLQS